MSNNNTSAGVNIRDKYDEWVKLTKRNGKILVGSMQEFFDWLDEFPSREPGEDLAYLIHDHLKIMKAVANISGYGILSHSIDKHIEGLNEAKRKLDECESPAFTAPEKAPALREEGKEDEEIERLSLIAVPKNDQFSDRDRHFWQDGYKSCMSRRNPLQINWTENALIDEDVYGFIGSLDGINIKIAEAAATKVEVLAGMLRSIAFALCYAEKVNPSELDKIMALTAPSVAGSVEERAKGYAPMGGDPEEMDDELIALLKAERQGKRRSVMQEIYLKHKAPGLMQYPERIYKMMEEYAAYLAGAAESEGRVKELEERLENLAKEYNELYEQAQTWKGESGN